MFWVQTPGWGPVSEQTPPRLPPSPPPPHPLQGCATDRVAPTTCDPRPGHGTSLRAKAPARPTGSGPSPQHSWNETYQAGSAMSPLKAQLGTPRRGEPSGTAAPGSPRVLAPSPRVATPKEQEQTSVLGRWPRVLGNVPRPRGPGRSRPRMEC